MAMHMFISKKLVVVIVVVVIGVIIAGALGLVNLQSASTTIRVQTSNIAARAGEVAKGSLPTSTEILSTGDAVKNAQACRDNMVRIESAKRAVMERSGVTTADVSADAVTREMGGKVPRCPSGGQYMLGNMQVRVRCSIGTNHTPDAADDHIMLK